MKKVFITLLSAVFFSSPLTAQITIDQGDFADAGDTVRVSQTGWPSSLDYKAAGANYTWDFSSLQWQSQFVDTFLNPMFTGASYAFTFSNLPINPYRSNIAKRADNTLTTLPLVSSIFSDGINFYYKSQTFYRQKGIGMKVSGFPTAVPMTHADTLYRFPMNYGNADSAWSDYTVNVAQLGTYAHKQHRVNEIDGWGTLITPFGTFDALRVRTEIRGSDSLYIDTLNFGFKINNDIQREYKWFGKNQKDPLLQVNTQAGVLGLFQNFEFVTKVIYRDSVRFEPTGIFDAAQNEIQFSVFPNPSNGLFYISLPENISNAVLTLTDINGKLLLSRQLNALFDVIDASEFAKGVYILTIQSSEGRAQKKLVLQ